MQRWAFGGQWGLGRGGGDRLWRTLKAPVGGKSFRGSLEVTSDACFGRVTLAGTRQEV